MRLLVLLFLLYPTLLSVELVEVWDCGTQASKVSMKIAEGLLKQCPLTKDSVNLCCKYHDYCYETSELTNFTREYCDSRFCACLHDAEDVHNSAACDLQLDAACKIVKSVIGAVIFPFAHPKNFTKKFEKFVDARPLGLDMKTLVDSCINAKGMAVHCHNSVYRCLERNKVTNLTKHSHEDCPSIMFECLQTIGDTKDIEPCPSLALEMAARLNVYGELKEEQVGQAAISIYPILSARLLHNCDSIPSIGSCLRTFDNCSSDPLNREEKPEFFNAARRVKLVCHRGLRECIEEATREETKEECIEARDLALSRIREEPYEEKSVVKEGASRAWKSISSSVKNIFRKNSTTTTNTSSTN